MSQQPIKRKYSFSDGTLAELGDTLVLFAERDLTEMLNFGYDQPRIDSIKVKITTFKNFPPDEYYTGLLMVATADKNSKLKIISEVSEGIVRRAMNKFGTDAPEVKGFGWTGYITKTDSDKMVVNRLVHKAGTDNQAALSSEGLTALILGNLNTGITNADTAITKKKQRVSERDVAVSQRITIGNDLYSELVKLADTGKHIWEDVNEALYNDYVIYQSVANMQTVNGTVAPNTIHQPSVVVNNVADEIEIEVTSGAVTVYFSDDPTDEPAPGQTTFDVSPGTPFSGTAAQLDWSTTNFRLLLKNSDALVPAVFSVVVRG